MIGVGLSLGSVACRQPSGGAPAETLVRTALGTWAFSTMGNEWDFATGTISVPAGSTLVFALASDTGDSAYLDAITYAGVDISGSVEVVKVDVTGSTFQLMVYRHYCATALSGVVAVTFGGDTVPSIVLMLACAQVGVVNAAADKKPTACGTSAAPSSGTTGTLTQAHEMAYGFVVAECASSDNLANYADPWTSGQRVHESSYHTLVLVEGYSIRTVDTAIAASKALTASAPWVAACLTLRAA